MCLGLRSDPCFPPSRSGSAPTFGQKGRGRGKGGEGPPSPSDSPRGPRPPGRTVQLHRQLPRPLQVQDGEAAVVRVPDDHVHRPAGTPGCGEPAGQPHRQCRTRPQRPGPHLGAGSAPDAPRLRTAAALPSRFHPWGHGRRGRTPSRLGHPHPGEAAAGVGSGGPRWDSQLPEGADGHGRAPRSHVQSGGLGPMALLLQVATRGGHGHQEPGPCELGSRPREGPQGWGQQSRAGPCPTSAQLYLLGVKAGLGLDGADGRRGPRGSPRPLTQGAAGQEQS